MINTKPDTLLTAMYKFYFRSTNENIFAVICAKGEK